MTPDNPPMNIPLWMVQTYRRTLKNIRNATSTEAAYLCQEVRHLNIHAGRIGHRLMEWVQGQGANPTHMKWDNGLKAVLYACGAEYPTFSDGTEVSLSMHDCATYTQLVTRVRSADPENVLRDAEDLERFARWIGHGFMDQDHRYEERRIWREKQEGTNNGSAGDVNISKLTAASEKTSA